MSVGDMMSKTTIDGIDDFVVKAFDSLDGSSSTIANTLNSIESLPVITTAASIASTIESEVSNRPAVRQRTVCIP